MASLSTTTSTAVAPNPVYYNATSYYAPSEAIEMGMGMDKSSMGSRAQTTTSSSHPQVPLETTKSSASRLSSIRSSTSLLRATKAKTNTNTNNNNNTTNPAMQRPPPRTSSTSSLLHNHRSSYHQQQHQQQQQSSIPRTSSSSLFNRTHTLSSLTIPSRSASTVSSTNPVRRSQRAIRDEQLIVSRKYSISPYESQRIVLEGAVVTDKTCLNKHEVDSEVMIMQQIQIKIDKSISSTSTDHHEPRSICKKMGDGVPSLQFSSWHKSWVVDLFSLPHNAIRRELIDLYDMIESMEKRKRDFHVELELGLFFTWLRTFQRFLYTYFTFEEKVMFPWVESRCIMMTDLCRAMRLACKTKLKSMLNSIFKAEKHLKQAKKVSNVYRLPRRDSIWAKIGLFHEVSDGDRVLTTEQEQVYHASGSEFTADQIPHVLRTVVDKFVSELMIYLRRQMKELPSLVVAAFQEDEKDKFDKRAAQFWFDQPGRTNNLYILGYWIKEIYGEKMFREWKYDHWGPAKMVLSVNWEYTHQKHLAIAKRFRQESASYKKNTISFSLSSNGTKLIPTRFENMEEYKADLSICMPEAFEDHGKTFYRKTPRYAPEDLYYYDDDDEEEEGQYQDQGYDQGYVEGQDQGYEDGAVVDITDQIWTEDYGYVHEIEEEGEEKGPEGGEEEEEGEEEIPCNSEMTSELSALSEPPVPELPELSSSSDRSEEGQLQGSSSGSLNYFGSGVPVTPVKEESVGTESLKNLKQMLNSS